MKKAKVLPGGNSHIQRTGVLVGEFKEPLRGTKLLFCGRGLKFVLTNFKLNSTLTDPHHFR